METVKLIDTHCHLSEDDYEDLDLVISRALQEKVLMIASSCDLKSQEENLKLVREYKDKIFLSMGYHPSEAASITKEDLKKLEEKIVNNKEIVALGEIGLDYYREPVDKELQQKLFRSQLSLAESLNLPVVIHTRSASDDTIKILKEYNVKGVIHCFSDSLDVAREYLKLGFYLGIGGIVTFKNTKLPQILKEIPLEKIVLETDAPYITPEPIRKEKNQPLNVKIIAKKVSEIYELPYEITLEILKKNTLTLFDLDK